MSGKRACCIEPGTRGAAEVCPHTDLPVSSPCQDQGRDTQRVPAAALVARGQLGWLEEGCVDIPFGVPCFPLAFHRETSNSTFEPNFRVFGSL